MLPDDWLIKEHDKSYFSHIRTETEYIPLCNIFRLDPNDENTPKTLKAYWRIYQHVYKHPEETVAVFYRLRDLSDLSNRVIAEVYKGQGNYQSGPVNKYLHSLIPALLQGTLASLKDSNFKLCEKEFQLVFDTMTDSSKASIRSEHEIFIDNLIELFDKSREQMIIGATTSIEKISNSAQSLSINIDLSNIERILADTYLESNWRDAFIDKMIIHFQKHDNRFNHDNFKVVLKEAHQDLKTIFEDNFTDNFDKLSTRFCTLILLEHPKIKAYFGCNKPFHELVERGMVYAPREIEHNRNMNMIWVYANLQQNRKFIIISEMNDANKFRVTASRMPNTPSAFSFEIAAAIDCGYSVTMEPSGKPILTNTALSSSEKPQIDFKTVYKDFSNPAAFNHVSACYEDARAQVSALSSNSISAPSVRSTIISASSYTTSYELVRKPIQQAQLSQSPAQPIPAVPITKVPPAAGSTSSNDNSLSSFERARLVFKQVQSQPSQPTSSTPKAKVPLPTGSKSSDGSAKSSFERARQRFEPAQSPSDQSTSSTPKAKDLPEAKASSTSSSGNSPASSLEHARQQFQSTKELVYTDSSTSSKPEQEQINTDPTLKHS